MEEDSPDNTRQQQQSTLVDAKGLKPHQNQHNKNNKTPNLSPDEALKIHHFFLSFAETKQLQEHPDPATRAQFVKENISTLKHKNTQQFKTIIQDSLIQDYQNHIDAHNIEKITIQSTKNFEELTRLFKDSSVNPTIVNVTFQAFKNFWMKYDSEYGKLMKKHLLDIWRSVPYAFLFDFLVDFCLMNDYRAIKPNEMFSIISGGLFQNKIQQYCQYYRIYKHKHASKETKKLFSNFEDIQIIPRITKKDQIFTEYVIKLLQNDEELAAKTFDCLEMKQYEKLAELTHIDMNKHPRLLQYLMIKTYKHSISSHREWYIIEDKISYNSTFIQWLANDIEKKFSKRKKEREEKQSDSSQHSNRKLTYGISNEDQAKCIAKSLLFRAGINKESGQNYKENPLYALDDYIPAEHILNSIKHRKTENTYLTLLFFKSTPKDIIFIASPNNKFHQACQALLKAKIVGFDSEFWAVSNKYEQGGISIIQLSVDQTCYIFDYRALMKCKQFNKFIVQLFENEKIIKIGHAVSNDFRYLARTFHEKMKIQSFLDLVTISNRLYPQQIQKSLALFCEKFLKINLCKYQQQSNWNRRPLKKTQLAYAAIDALCCVKILEKMLDEKNLSLEEFVQMQPQEKLDQSQQQQKKQQITPQKKKTQEAKPEIDFDFIKFKEYCQNPIFLVDNMLKKLCSTMRNCGIDTEFISIKDHNLAFSQCKQEKRIFVTRDTKVLNKKLNNFPVYLLKERSDSDIMFKQLVRLFNLDLSQYKTLSRCVKCNNPELLVIGKEQAMKEIHFVYEDSEINEFWRCSKCKQIYWEGGQFKKAKNKYEEMRK